MEPTKKEKSILSDSTKNILILFLSAIAFTSLVYAKFEYKPIVISYRTVTAGTAYVPSTSRATNVKISVQIACQVSLTGGQAGNITLQTSPDNITYTTIAQITNSSTGTLVVGLTLNNSNGGELIGDVPAGYYYKIVNTSTTNTPTYSILTPAQETQN